MCANLFDLPTHVPAFRPSTLFLAGFTKTLKDLWNMFLHGVEEFALLEVRHRGSAMIAG